jgi:hypothetical protein
MNIPINMVDRITASYSRNRSLTTLQLIAVRKEIAKLAAELLARYKDKKER